VILAGRVALHAISRSDYHSADTREHGGTLSTVTLIETGNAFGTNNREQERPDPD
jgi:hypothetical protein